MVYRISILSFAFLTCAFSDTLYLRSGATIQGSYAGGDTRQVRILVGDHIESYQIEEVKRLEFGGTPGGAAGVPAPRYQEQGMRVDTPNHTDRDRDSVNGDRPAPPPDNYANATGAEIPAGTNLVVRLIDSVDSERDTLGQTYRASLDEPVMANGQALIPRGADVTVKLVADKESGKFSGKTALTLDVQSLQINGRMVDVNTSEVTQASGSRSARTAKTVGGGAVAGAVLGGIFGGGKGAAIGAASGGTLGAGAEVLTKGQRVRIPSETRLSFLLQQPVRF